MTLDSANPIRPAHTASAPAPVSYPRRLLSNLLASLIVWLLAIILATSFSALIFTGQLASYYGAGIGIALISAIVITLVGALFSTDNAIIAYPQSTAAAIIGAVASSIVASAPASMPDSVLFLTVILTMSTAALITGLFFVILGMLKAGNLIRYIPYPVIGGFMAGSGWLLVQGAMNVMLGQPVRPDMLVTLFELQTLAHWLPGLALALILLWLLRRTNNALYLPAVITGSIILFYGLILATDSMSAASQDGWLLTTASAQIEWQPILLADLRQVDGGLVIAQATGIAALIIISTLHLLLNASGIELTVNRELDLNHELTVVGAGNALSGILGAGIIGFPSVTMSTLVHRLRGEGRIVGLLLSLWLLLSLFFGTSIINLFPRVILGGLLLYLALNFLVEWLYDTWFRLPRKDYLIIVSILLVIGLVGFLEGVAIGIAATIILFVLEYSRISVVKQAFSGQVFRSNLDRPYREKQLLAELGQHIWIMRLQGFIFFGTSRQFYQRIRARVLDPDEEALLFVILDFRLVRGLDVSAVMDFVRLRQLAQTHGIRLLFTEITPELRAMLVNAGFGPLDSDASQQFSDLDFAMEWCENDLLNHAESTNGQRVTIQEQFESRTMTRLLDVATLTHYLERVELDQGAYIAHQGEEPDALFFIESGRVEIQLTLENGRSVRLRSMRAGTIIGEIGFYLDRARSASIVVAEKGVFYRLTRDALHRMSQENPEAASGLHQFIACVVAERLVTTNQLVQAFME